MCAVWGGSDKKDFHSAGTSGEATIVWGAQPIAMSVCAFNRCTHVHN